MTPISRRSAWSARTMTDTFCARNARYGAALISLIKPMVLRRGVLAAILHNMGEMARFANHSGCVGYDSHVFNC